MVVLLLLASRLLCPAPFDPGPVEKRLVYTVAEAAELIGVSRGTYYQGIKRGQLPYLRVGVRIVVPKVALENYLAKAGAATA